MQLRKVKPYLYLLPALGLAFLFTYLPFLKAALLSFFTVSTTGHVQGFAGIKNYQALFSSPYFRASIRNTLLFIVLFVPLNTLVCLLAATLTRRQRKGQGIAEAVFSLPMAISLATASLVFKEIFRGKTSIINTITGLKIDWLSEPVPAMIVLVLLGVFLDFGIDYLLLLSSYRSQDRYILEAARIDGCNDGQMLMHIELPLIKPMLMTIIFLALKDAIMISAPIMILTEGGPFRSTETIMFFYYIEAFRSGNRAVETTMCTLLGCLSIVFGLVATRRKK